MSNILKINKYNYLLNIYPHSNNGKNIFPIFCLSPRSQRKSSSWKSSSNSWTKTRKTALPQTEWVTISLNNGLISVSPDN